MLALGLNDGQVVVVDETTGEEKWAVQAHPQNSLVHVAMPPNGRFVASVGNIIIEDDDIFWRIMDPDLVFDCKIWDATSGELHRALATHDGTWCCICEVDFALTGRRVLDDRCPVIAHTTRILAVAFSPCGQRLATRDSDGAVIMWDTWTGEAERRMHGRAGFARAIAFTADGARLASGSGDSGVDVFDAMTGELLLTIEEGEEEEQLICVSFSPTAVSMLAINHNTR